MLPEKVIVAGITYQVEEKEYVEFLDNANALGCCTYDKALIEVKSTMSNERKEEVFIHELFHAILYESGFDEHDEEMVNRASKVLYQVLKDNPDLLNLNPSQIIINGTISEVDIEGLKSCGAVIIKKP